MRYADHVRTLIAYNAWANAGILRSAKEVGVGDLEADLGGYDTILGTLNHYLWAQQMWLGRLRGEPNAKLVGKTPPDLWTEFASADANLTAWAADLTDDGCERMVEYHDSKGAPHQRTVAPLLAHVVNHGTYHRGEAALMLTRLGRSPGDLDLVYFIPEGV